MIERLSAFEMAVKNEMIEKEFYERNAKIASHPLSKALFEHMASEELNHHEGLKRLQEELQSKGKLPDECKLEMTETTVQEVLEGLLKKESNIKKMTDDDLAMIRNAVRLEEKVLIFYERLVDRAENPHDKTLFGFCVSTEKAHLQSLKDAEAFLAKFGVK